MATYATLRNGSSGEDVKKLQQALTNAGYNPGGIDGIFGANTEAAVKSYQTANGLTADGIAGDQTLGKIYGLSTAANSSGTGATGTAKDIAVNQPQSYSSYSYNPDSGSAQKYAYNPETNAAYTQAMAALEAAQKNKPVYNDVYGDKVQEAYERITGRKSFTYNPETDPAYQQYRNMYIQQGQQAMRDTVAQGAALTGGYGNTYAQAAGQQQYDAYLQRLNDVLPTLRAQAREEYNAEGDELYRRYSMLQDLENTAYGRSRDALSDYWQGLNYATDRADTAYSRGAENWYQSQQMAADDYYKGYQMGLDAQNTAYDRLVTLISATGYTPSEAELAAAGMPASVAAAWRQYYQQQQALAYSSGGGSGGSSGRSYSSRSYSGSSGSSGTTAKVTKTPTSTVTQGNDIGSFRQTVEPWRQTEQNAGSNKTLNGIDKYAGWTATDWEGYFALYRKQQGQAAALAEMQRLQDNGSLPSKMVQYARSGATGGKIGH